MKGAPPAPRERQFRQAGRPFPDVPIERQDVYAAVVVALALAVVDLLTPIGWIG